jgi:hypothetical protein
MEKYQDNYHEKFDRAYDRGFTGQIFNPVEFIHHLENINFHFESEKIARLSDEAIEAVKSRFQFYQYGASIDGLPDITDASYDDAFVKLIAKYGKKYGFRDKTEASEE